MVDVAWNLTDLADVERSGLKVFSTFACGGGSSMGYKRAGYEIVAANDIDPEMQEHYEMNLHPPAFYLSPVESLVTDDLPDHLFDVDILDGSPPCSTFSMSGSREAVWGKAKKFREGQQVQVLDDLFFSFLRVAERLRPKVILAENVKGMLAGNAKGYVVAVVETLKAIGYRPQVFLLNAAQYGVPQSRERVFVCAVREDISTKTLKVPAPTVTKAVTAAQAVAGLPIRTKGDLTPMSTQRWHHSKPGQNMNYASKRLQGKASDFNQCRLNGNWPCPTLTTAPLFHWDYPRKLNFAELKRFQSFPDDYRARSESIGRYLIGMSVPPKMVEALARQVRETWLS